MRKGKERVLKRGSVRSMQKTHLLLQSVKYMYSQIELEGKNCSKRYIPSGVPVREKQKNI